MITGGDLFNYNMTVIQRQHFEKKKKSDVLEQSSLQKVNKERVKSRRLVFGKGKVFQGSPQFAYVSRRLICGFTK